MSRTEVALCTCDGARYLSAQLASIVHQSRAVDGVTVGDDGSTDDTVALLEAFRTRLPIELAHNPQRLGAVANFERTLGRARGDLVFLCDQDDQWRGDKVERMRHEADAHAQALLFWSDARIVDAEGVASGRGLTQALGVTRTERQALAHGRVLPLLLRRNVVTGATVMLRRELIDLALPFPPGYWHDEWLAVLAAATGSARFVDEHLVDYRIHATNQAGLRGVEPLARLRAMTSPRGDYHVERVRKLEALLARIEQRRARVPAELRREVQACLQHWSARAALAKDRWRRLPTVASQLASGSYRKFSSGMRSAVRDLIEPLP